MLLSVIVKDNLSLFVLYIKKLIFDKNQRLLYTKKMGKGDRKTRKGKIAMGSYGRLRPRRKKPDARPEQPTKKTEEKADES